MRTDEPAGRPAGLTRGLWLSTLSGKGVLATTHRFTCFFIATIPLLISIYSPGQSMSGIQIIQPSPNDGRPLMVNTPCNVNGPEGETWETPILVYSDDDVELFIDRACLTESGVGFGRSGKYEVALYSHYKGHDSFCNTLTRPKNLPPQDTAEFMRECRLVVYESRWLSVDTRKKTMTVTNTVLLDRDGRHLQTLKDDHESHDISSLEKDPHSRAVWEAINRITELVQKEREHWDRINRMYGSH